MSQYSPKTLEMVARRMLVAVNKARDEAKEWESLTMNLKYDFRTLAQFLLDELAGVQDFKAELEDHRIQVDNEMIECPHCAGKGDN